jgi:membrane dipeptidase
MLQSDDDNALAHARRLLAASPLIDGHNDFPWQVRERAKGDLTALDIRQPQPSVMTDLPRLRAGGVGGQFWAVYVPADVKGGEAVTTALEQIDVVHRMLAAYPDVLELALTADDIERIQRAGRIASMIGIEGGHSIDNSLAVLRMFHALGARYLTLTHTANTEWADSANDAPVHHGLTPFGEDVIRELNRLGMLVDLSHVSPDTMRAALRVSRAPVVFTHSSARTLVDVPRNVPDEVLDLLKANNGVVMVTFVPAFVSQEAAAAWDREIAEQARLKAQGLDTDAVSRGITAWRAAHPAPQATLAQVADHVDYLRHRLGADHVGIGSDFDGIEWAPAGLEDVSKYPELIAELVRRGYSDSELEKITRKNILRVMRDVEASAARETSGPGPPE